MSSTPLAVFPAGAPNGLADDLSSLGDLPAAAREPLAELLSVSVGAVIAPDSEAQAARLCAEHGLDMDDLARFVRAVRLLVREAARIDLATEALHRDVLTLSGDADVARRVAACHQQVAAELRGERIVASLERFGPVLRDVGLRIDHVPVSRHLAGKVYPIGMLSLPYREEGKDKLLSLQVTPALLRKLKLMLDAAMK